MPGQDVHLERDAFDQGTGLRTNIGGDGGEAPQWDGRGGRGAKSALTPEIREEWGLPPEPPHMKPPYFEPRPVDYGSGGHGSDTPQYVARRLIIERMKSGYIERNGLNVASVWYDREVVPMDWLNGQLTSEGHRWTAAIVAMEYEFADAVG